MTTQISKFLDTDKSPTRRLGGTDNRGSHSHLAMHWAQELAAQDKNKGGKSNLATLAEALASNEDKIAEELIAVQEMLLIADTTMNDALAGA